MGSKIGSIHLCSYIARKKSEVSQKKKDEFQLANSAAYVEKFLMDMVFNPGGAVDPNTIFSTARKDTNKLIDSFENLQIIKQVYFQIGQEGTLEDIQKIESDPDFIQWVDPYIIEYIKDI